MRVGGGGCCWFVRCCVSVLCAVSLGAAVCPSCVYGLEGVPVVCRASVRWGQLMFVCGMWRVHMGWLVYGVSAGRVW